MSIKGLDQRVIDVINRQATIVVVATVDEDGSPRTAPFGWVYAEEYIRPHAAGLCALGRTIG